MQNMLLIKVENMLNVAVSDRADPKMVETVSKFKHRVLPFLMSLLNWGQWELI